MKFKFKFSGRERWMLALSPALAIGGIYFFFFMDGLDAELDKELKRAEATIAPPPPAAAPLSLVRARATLAETKTGIEARELRIQKLEERLAATVKPAAPVAGVDSREAARVIERMEGIFARNGITPQVSEAISESEAGDRAPKALLTVLAPPHDAEKGVRKSRVWHCIFDDCTQRFEKAFRDLERELPAVVPLSLNLVYNPDTDGETRLLELWLVY